MMSAYKNIFAVSRLDIKQRSPTNSIRR